MMKELVKAPWTTEHTVNSAELNGLFIEAGLWSKVRRTTQIIKEYSLLKLISNSKSRKEINGHEPSETLLRNKWKNK